MSEEEHKVQMALCNKAGLSPDEMFEHPEYGLCISVSGVRKLARLAPDQAQAVRVVEHVERIVIDQGYPHG